MPLRYVGRPPDTSATVAPASAVYSSAANSSNLFSRYLVTTSWLANQITTLSSADPPVMSDYITQQAANYATQSQVTTALQQFIANSQIGAANGYAKLVNGGVPVGPGAQIASVSTNNKIGVYAMTNQLLPSGNTYAITGTTTSFPLGTVTVPNPGYPWIPIPFAYVQGASTASGPGRLIGSGNYALLTVTPQGLASPVYAAGYMTDDPIMNYYPVVPCAVPGINTTGSPVTPLTQQPLTLTTTFTLSVSGSGSSTTGYTVSGTGLVFYIAVVPAW